MAARKKKRAEHSNHADERWLLTYSDLITLLMALFMVLFSISSVNKSKFETLQRALQEAFSGKILPGGHAIKETGGSNNVKNPSTSEPFSSLQPYMGGKPEEQAGAKSGAPSAQELAETKGFEELKKRIDKLAREKGLSGKIQTRITDDGLMIRLRTDNLLFDSGSAIPRPESLDILRQLARLLDAEGKHPMTIEGHTDTVPIRSLEFPSNWELSSARAASVVRTFIADGVTADRMTAQGRAYLDPVADNTSDAGRSLNRRVEILMPRTAVAAATSISSAATSTDSSSASTTTTSTSSSP